MHCKGVRGNACTRFQSQKATDTPHLLSMLESMKVIAPNPSTDLVNDNNIVEIEPRSSILLSKLCSPDGRNSR